MSQTKSDPISMSGRPAILCETGPDESFLLGTRDQLAELANNILHMISESVESTVWGDKKVELPECPKGLTDPMAETAIWSVVIVDTESDRRSLMNQIRINGGETPIDWDGYDKQSAQDS